MVTWYIIEVIQYYNAVLGSWIFNVQDLKCVQIFF